VDNKAAWMIWLLISDAAEIRDASFV